MQSLTLVTRRLPVCPWHCPPAYNLTKILLEQQRGMSTHESDNVDKISQMPTNPDIQKKEPGVWQQAHDREANGVVWQILRHPRLHKETLKRNGGWGVLGL